MSVTTIEAMTVVQARQLLQDTSRLSSARIDEAHAAVAAFYAAKPQNQRCVACGGMRFSEHSAADGEPVWACSGCHRLAKLTSEEWHVEWTRQREAAEEHLAAAAAAAPEPRAVLRDRLGALSEARIVLDKLEHAVPVARSAVWEAQVRVDAAEAAAAEANEGAAANLAVALAEGTPVGPASSAAAARAELANAVDALVVCKNARTILEGKLADARSAVSFVSDKVKKAGHAVLVAEKLEPLLNAAIEARAQYVDAVGALGWLVRNHAINGDDRRAHQILGDANVPPSTWHEAQQSAGTAQMEAAFAALLADAEAAI
jgi:hypothetical protein